MRFLAKEIQIKHFRKIDNLTINLGDKITVLSGINGVGKSNIMSLIAMSFGKMGSRIAGGNFFPHFDEYFIITEDEYNKQTSNKYEAYLKISADDGVVQKRLGLKNDIKQGRGIRVLPRSTNYFTKDKASTEVIRETKDKFNIGDSARVPVPTIFISLSRLFPMGETELDEKLINNNNEIIKDGVVNKYVEWYNRVLPLSIDVNKYKTSNIKKVVNANGRIHVELVDSDARTESVGEDNLGTIISALVDFFYLKEKQKSEYVGGIVCIDEVDASLHPSAQIRLFELLEELSEELNLQIFMTTHSMTMLNKIIKKQNRDSENFKLVYILDPRIPRIKENINSIEDIKADMYDENTYFKPIIKVYCEDIETEFIFNQLIKILNHEENLALPEYKIFPMALGHTQLENLREFDKYFESTIILVDGDAKSREGVNFLNKYLDEDIKGLNPRELKENVLSLPSFLAPESYYYYVLRRLLDDKPFWQQLGRQDLRRDYTSRNLNIILDKVKLDNENNIKNDELKKVFSGENLNRIKEFIDESQLLTYYYKKYPEELLVFKEDVKRVFDIIENKVKANL
ncbi:AAA family ATPase [Mediannikoviicoccus vaginalis]|uniref:AAA family ATPase n=1 Tax=Mediannikoviicoccus vaginalis TaxID=2899727 RepID=UPI001F19F8D6|nr:AAA family ATPase [Mediannikoviicoccus vaginalis]